MYYVCGLQVTASERLLFRMNRVFTLAMLRDRPELWFWSSLPMHENLSAEMIVHS